MSKSRLTKPLESGSEYVAYARKHPALKSYHVAGSHHTFDGPDGRVTICSHNRELAPWLRKKIMLELIAIGLGCLILAHVLPPILAQFKIAY
jgi:hypothetical protein